MVKADEFREYAKSTGVLWYGGTNPEAKQLVLDVTATGIEERSVW